MSAKEKFVPLAPRKQRRLEKKKALPRSERRNTKAEAVAKHNLNYITRPKATYVDKHPTFVEMVLTHSHARVMVSSDKQFKMGIDPVTEKMRLSRPLNNVDVRIRLSKRGS